MPLVACVQLRSGPDIAANLARVDHWVGQAAAGGAILVATPENTTLLTSPERKVALAEPLDGPTHRALAAVARRHGVWLLVGSVAEACATDPSRCHNTSVLYDRAGTLVAYYRKLHLFDIDLADGTHFRESGHVAPGAEVVVADTPVGRLGLTICYDLRFPELYRRLVDAGAELISVPSAFTLTTGRDHWHALLRARAIETQAYVLAPGQEGPHGPGRHSYGHSLIVDPWGTVLADCVDGEGVVFGEVDRDRVAAVRRGMPVGEHRRF
ncbi:MAG: carbon-nitrogen hydrolase family protein [Myxococcales bacterium]|nr:carbon-nitrogen hydrolase family protein [Myxococcales bacterium]